MTEYLFPRMLQEYYVAQMRKLRLSRRRRRAGVRTFDDVAALRAQVRKRLRTSFGRMPRRTRLNLRCTGVLERNGYRIEKLIFDSRPGFPVTANLYVPEGRTPPFPCVLGTCGHSMLGKAEPAYQSFAQDLVRRGFLVLVYDPISQGERVQYLTAVDGIQPRGCCEEHNMLGNCMRLYGDFFGSWRLWDGMRALDVLLARPEADTARVGVTGNSGGGTMSTYLFGLDDRFTMGAPSCFVTTYRHNLENELPADSEQIPPRVLQLGLDMADFFVAQIPKPVLLLGQTNDYFDIRGLRETFEELRALYAAAGAENRVRLFIGPDDHGYTQPNREAMVRFFCEQAGIDLHDAPPPEPEPAENLWCTPDGQVLRAGARSVSFFVARDAARTVRRRPAVETEKLQDQIRRALGIPPARDRTALHYRILRPRGADVSPWRSHSLFAVETEPGILAILHRFRKEGRALFHLGFPNDAPMLYIPHISACEDAGAEFARELQEYDDFFAVDPRGIGMSRPLTCNNVSNFFAPYGNDYFYASYALMLGVPMPGRRVYDVLRVLDLLDQAGFPQADLVGRGLGALTAAFAACLHPHVRRVTLYNSPLSYFEMTQTTVRMWPLSSFPPGILRRFDLPDCYRLLLSRGLRIVDPWDACMRPLPPDEARTRCREQGLPEDVLAFTASDDQP